MKKLVLIALAVFSFNVSAVTVTINETTNAAIDAQFLDYGTYHHDVNTDLDWLTFGTLVGDPITFGHSLNSATAAYEPQGWRLASETEVRGLFDMYFEPEFTSTNGIMSGITEGDGQSRLIQARNSWLFDFGTDAVPT